jgi:hypothetical protein
VHRIDNALILRETPFEVPAAAAADVANSSGGGGGGVVVGDGLLLDQLLRGAQVGEVLYGACFST